MQDLKSKWIQSELDEWTEFNAIQLQNTPFTTDTKGVLINGFPKYAAPFLSFDLENYDCKFQTINAYYSGYTLNPKTKHYWFFGSDENGNPICIDSNSNDKIILLDHEQEFEPIQTINNNVLELFACLLEYKHFIDLINSQFGKDGFFDLKYTTKHVNELQKKLERINLNIFEDSNFWRSEINLLFENIKA
ncbi:hypothetical protein [Psychroserpens damuponensis]|uniref:hypothetical protein n=1 Tax=Psychroserpens damuponensis TaxID=943936 RepID=UPI0005915E62|nr:hypothetical protein [Psychroserpens damuponensis]